VAGHIVGKPDLEVRGAVEKTGGTPRKTYGDVKNEVTKDPNKA
jgi:uncharacterized protein YjbJ (UPF0337 family)